MNIFGSYIEDKYKNKYINKEGKKEGQINLGWQKKANKFNMSIQTSIHK